MSEDLDTAACTELGRRMSRLTTFVVVLFVLAGLAVSAVLFVLLLELQFRLLGEAELSLTVGVSMIVGVVGAILVAARVRRGLLRARAPAWIDELAANHRDRREMLEQIVSLW